MLSFLSNFSCLFRCCLSRSLCLSFSETVPWLYFCCDGDEEEDGLCFNDKLLLPGFPTLWSDLFLPSDVEELLLIVTFNPPEEDFEDKFDIFSLLCEVNGDVLWALLDDPKAAFWLVPPIAGIISIPPPPDEGSCGEVDEEVTFAIDKFEDNFDIFPPWLFGDNEWDDLFNDVLLLPLEECFLSPDLETFL